MKADDILAFGELQQKAPVGTVFIAFGSLDEVCWKLITRTEVQIYVRSTRGEFGECFPCAEMFNALDVVKVVTVPEVKS